MVLASVIATIFIYSVYKSRANRPVENEVEVVPTRVRPENWYWTDEPGKKLEEPPMKTIQQVRTNLKPNPHIIKEPRTHVKNIINLSDSVHFDFSICRMSNCFDFSRCNTNGPLKVHIVPKYKRKQSELNVTGESNIIHKSILKIIKESEHYEPDAQKACIFMLEDDTLDRDPLSQSFRPDLPNILEPGRQYGMNHIIFNLYSGSWPEYRENDFAGMKIGAAILVKASNSIAHHRPNFDISIPLFSYLQENENNDINHNYSISNYTQRRTYFLTFKGKRYVIGSGSETRNSLYHLSNQNDVIMLTTCRHGKKWLNSKDIRCVEDESNYNQHGFIDLMKESIFCLTPRGRRLGSFRFLEALSYGCIPVILSDGWVWPFGEIIDWSNAAIQFNENLLLQVPDLLRDIHQDAIERMQKNCRILYKKYFSTTKKIVMTTLAVLEQRIKNNLKV